MSRPALRVCRKPTMSSFPRSSTPHHAIDSAQVLPDRPYFGVIGALGSGDEIDLYQLTLNSSPGRLDFGLVIAGIGRQRASDIPDSGRLRAGAGYVEAREPGQFIHPGRSRETRPGLHPVPGRLGRQLEHTRWSFRDRQLSALGGSPAGAPPDVLIDRQLDSARCLTVLSPLLIPLAALGLSSSQGVSAAALTAPGTISITASVTVGSLAIRSAGASRGLLSNDEPAPFAVQGPGTSAPQEVAAGSLARPESEREGEPRPGEPAVAGRDPEASVVVISTGGFPLMGATAVGYWRWRGDLTLKLSLR